MFNNDPAGQAHQQRMQQDAEARAAAEKVNAEQEAAQRAALQPQNEKNEIVMKHANAALQEIQERQKLSAEQREAEKLNTELGQLSDTMREHFKQPSRFQAELKAEKARQAEIIARLQSIGAASADPTDNSTGGRIAFGGQDITHLVR